MQVILVKPVRKLGAVGETVKVKNGYGRNYLIPSELAIRATKENIAIFSEKRKEIEAKNSKFKQEAEVILESLEGKHLTYVVQAAADGRLFGSISPKDIALKVSEILNTKINYSNVLIEKVIKTTGVYTVKISLHPEVTSEILVVVAKTDSEAVDILRQFKEGETEKTDEQKEAEMAALEAFSEIDEEESE
jgi:large subunit ribosomal protein L9